MSEWRTYNKQMVKVRGVWIDPAHVIAVGAKHGHVVLDLTSGATINLGSPADDHDVKSVVNALWGRSRDE